MEEKSIKMMENMVKYVKEDAECEREELQERIVESYGECYGLSRMNYNITRLKGIEENCEKVLENIKELKEHEKLYQ